MEDWKNAWLETLDLSTATSQGLIKRYQELKCKDNPTIKEAVKLEREIIRGNLAHKKEIHRRVIAWEKRRTIGKKD